MKILQVNKFYYHHGGADTVMIHTGKLLEKKGHDVIYFSMRSDKNEPCDQEKYFVPFIDLNKGGIKNSIRIAGRLLYSTDARDRMERLLLKEKPDIVHLHNIYHQLSPSILHPIYNKKIPTVMSLHDYKLVCAEYNMLCRGKPCEDCAHGRYFMCFKNSCIKNSRLKSFLNTIEMYLHHSVFNIYDTIDVFIATSVFIRKMIERMSRKNYPLELLRNFSLERATEKPNMQIENAIVYSGRHSQEKGVLNLVKAMKGLDTKLYMLGRGPMEKELKKTALQENITNIKFTGFVSEDKKKEIIGKSLCLVLPTICYENNPLCVIEAFLSGKPVVASRIGGIPEIVRDHETGILFEPGNIRDMKEKISYAVNHQQYMKELGENAHHFLQEEYDADKHYEKLMEIYNMAITKKFQDRAKN
jgi:glycosyltransferase involved in cell wall biosynthesis